MRDSIASHSYNGHVIHIYMDDDAESPREWDNLGTMVCFHRRYTLGDANGVSQCLKDIRASKHYRETWDDYSSDHYRDLDNPRVMLETAEQCGFLVLPLYLYDHSGLTMNTTGFSCPWDSGQVGFIYATKEKIMNEFGGYLKRKRYCEHVRKSASASLSAEVSVYDQYLRGEVYGWELTGPDGADLESCWGYYSEHDAEHDARSSIPQLGLFDTLLDCKP
jgi:hypothetical protein